MGRIITCPSGLTGEVRGLKGKEGNILTDRKALRSGAVYDQILSNCWEKTTDFGPYEVTTSGLPNWNKVLIGDRIYAMIQIRALTYGEDFEFEIQCEEESCRKKLTLGLDLSEIQVKKLSDADKATFAVANRFEATVPSDGKKIWFKLTTGDDEKRVAQFLRSGSTELVTSLMLRVLEIEGIEEPKRRAYLADLPLRDLTDLIAEFDKHDCGIDTEIETECHHCYTVQRVQLPFDTRFWLPFRKKLKKED